MGVSKSSELEKTMQVWRSILDGLENGEETARRAGRWTRDHEWSLNRQRAVQIIADGIREHLDEWLDFAWASPGQDYVKKKAAEREKQDGGLAPQNATEPWLTPAQSPQPLAEDVEEEGLPSR
jgi:hypothetical protein